MALGSALGLTPLLNLLWTDWTNTPILPFTNLGVNPGAGSSSLTFTMKNAGAHLLGRWSIGSKAVSWIPDTTGRKLNDLERLVMRVISGLDDLQVVAELGGSISEPQFSVSSNLDKAVASRIQAVMGQEIAKAEKMVGAKLDSLWRIRWSWSSGRLRRPRLRRPAGFRRRSSSWTRWKSS